MFQIKKFDLLVSIYIFCIVVAELMGSKIFPLFSIGSFKLNASVGIFVIPFLFTMNDIVTEVYGFERTRSIIRSSLVIIFLLFIFSLFATSLPPATRFMQSETSYDLIFGKSARISAASLIAFAIAEFTDVLIFVKIRKKLGKKSLWLRNNVSNFISQFLDTTIFMVLAFYTFGKPISENFTFLISLILPYWLLKCSMSIIETPFVYMGVKWFNKNKDN